MINDDDWGFASKKSVPTAISSKTITGRLPPKQQSQQINKWLDTY